MEVSVENTSALGRRVKVSVPDAIVKEQLKARMSKLAREVHLKGFRPGKVPESVLQKKFGQSVRLEVIENVMREALTDAFKDVQVAGTPKIEEINDESGKDFKFTATLEVYPEIALASLQDIELEKRQATVTDADVEKMIDKLKDSLADWKSVSRETQSGDKLNVDFKRLLKEDGATEEEQKNVEMVLGSEGVLPGLTEALLGKEIGDTVEAELVYPNDWADAPAAGKSVTLWITVHSIFEKERLASEGLAKKLGLTTEDDAMLFAEVKKRMEEELQSALQEELREKVLEKLIEKNPLELPLALIEQEKEAIRRELSRQRKVNIPKEAMNQAEVEEQAKRRVELGLLLNEVIKKYNVKADPAAIRKEIEKIASRFPAMSEQVINAYYESNEMLHGVERMVLLEQAVNVMLGEMKQKEVVVTFDQVMNPER